MRNRFWRRQAVPFHMPRYPMYHPRPIPIFRPAPFDIFLCTDTFPLPSRHNENSMLQALNRRHQELIPSQPQIDSLLKFIREVKHALEIILSTPDSTSSIVIEEFREVGSLRKGTMLANHTIADIVVILRSLPTVEAVSSLGSKIVKDLCDNYKETYTFSVQDFGCELTCGNNVVRLLITTIPENAKLLDPDLHLKESAMILHMAAIRHASWFEENASGPTIKMLIRLIKDIHRRYEQLQALNVWSIELISHYSVMNTPTGQPLSITHAFCRFFQLLSAGLLLPSSPALIDPCEPPDRRINHCLDYEQMDQICSASQTLFRIICHGGYRHVLGLEPSKMSLVSEITYWGDAVVRPLEPAYADKVMDPVYADENVKLEDETEKMNS